MFFDDLKVVLFEGNVVQSDNFYPYGMEMAGGFKRISAKKNRFLFNQGTGDKKFNTERITDLELSFDMTKYRLYDYQIGRFVQSDPLADASPQEAWTPYQYGYNNPVSYNDPYGDCPVCLIGGLAFLGYMLSAKPANAPGMDAEANKKAMVEAQDSYDRSIVGSTVAALAIGQILYEEEWGTRDSEPKPENQDPGNQDPEKKVPNPNGKKGGPDHQRVNENVAKEIEERGNIAEPEKKINTPEGEKGYRYADQAEVDPETGEVIEYHQVGKQNKNGTPVSRERKAKKDIEDATGKPVKFHPYNKDEK